VVLPGSDLSLDKASLRALALLRADKEAGLLPSDGAAVVAHAKDLAAQVGGLLQGQQQETVPEEVPEETVAAGQGTVCSNCASVLRKVHRSCLKAEDSTITNMARWS
jgi:hypothetical protein